MRPHADKSAQADPYRHCDCEAGSNLNFYMKKQIASVVPPMQ
ncbi:MAG: hypothetical protein V1781_04895 [Bacteroidota bacterium]